MSLGTSWEGLKASWKGLIPSLEGLGASWEGLEASWEGLGASLVAAGRPRGGGEWTDGRTDGWTDGVLLSAHCQWIKLSSVQDIVDETYCRYFEPSL